MFSDMPNTNNIYGKIWTYLSLSFPLNAHEGHRRQLNEAMSLLIQLWLDHIYMSILCWMTEILFPLSLGFSPGILD